MSETTVAALATGGGSSSPEQDQIDPGYWYTLIDEEAAADFMDVVRRTMQGWRQRGDGPRFVRISGRCIKYRRIDLRGFSEAQLRTSTSDDSSPSTC